MSFTGNVMQVADSVIKVDVSNIETCCTHKEVDIGVGAAKALSTTKLTEFVKMSFGMKCLDILHAAIEKIIDRSPLQYSLVHAL